MTKTEKNSKEGKLPRGLAILNEFVAACLDSAQKELCDTGGVKGAVNFAYGLSEPAGTPVISRYVLARHGTDGEEKEIEEVTNYAKTSHAEAVSVVMDLAGDPDIHTMFPGSDGVLLIAAVSRDGSAAIMRSYIKSADRFVFAAPKVTDSFSIPALEGLFASFQ